MLKKTIEIAGNSYVIEYPNVGKFIDIKVLETQLSKGMSTQMVYGTVDQQAAYIYIMTYAHLAVLCPQLMKDLKVDSLFDLSMEDFDNLVEVYSKEIQPWLSRVKEQVKERIDERSGEHK